MDFCTFYQFFFSVKLQNLPLQEYIMHVHQFTFNIMSWITATKFMLDINDKSQVNTLVQLLGSIGKECSTSR